MFLLLPISLLQNYLATRGLTWKNMLTESLGALQRGVFLLSGKPCCAYLPPTDGGVFQGHLCLWSSGPSCLSTHWQHCLLAFPCSLLQPLPTLAETDRKVLILWDFFFLVGFESTWRVPESFLTQGREGTQLARCWPHHWSALTF